MDGAETVEASASVVAADAPDASPQESASVSPATLPAEVKATAPAPDTAMAERLAALEAQVKAQTDALAGFASQALADLPESVRKAVSELAGDDPARQLTTLQALRRNGLAAGAIPQGTTTAPAAHAPQPGSMRDEDTEALETYRKLEASAPVVAATFRASHGQRIDRALARTKPS